MARDIKKILGIGALIERVGRLTVLEALLSGATSATHTFNPEEIDKFAGNINSVIERANQKNAHKRGVKESGQVHIVSIEDPAKNTRYYTIMQNGVIEITGEDGKIDIDEMRENGLVGPDSLKKVLTEAFAGSSIPLLHPGRRKGRKGRKGKKPDGKRAPPAQLQIMIDPALRQYLGQKEAYLTSAAFSKERGRSSVLIRPEELQDFVPGEVIAAASELGYKVTLQSNVDFVRSHKKIISQVRGKRVKHLMGQKIVKDKINEYLEEIARAGQGSKIIEFIEKSSNARHGYKFMADKKNLIDGVSPPEMMEVLREVMYEATANTPERQHRVGASLREWIRLSKAVSYIEKDQNIQQVIPYFEGTDRKEDENVADKVYEGIRLLLKNMMNQTLHYSVGELEFILDGLWHKGYLGKYVKGEGENDPNVGDRDLRGMNSQFVTPGRHLMRRFSQYDAALNESLEFLLRDEKISKTQPLANQRDDYTLGVKLYYAIPESKRREVFVNQLTGEPLAPPGSKSDKGEALSMGATLNWILKYYVGVKRDDILQKIKAHYSAKE